MKKAVFTSIIIIMVIMACSDHNSTPKPRGYIRIDLKEPFYINFENRLFSFQYSEYAHIDTVKTQDKNNFWFNLVYPAFNAQIHFTYIPITEQNFKKAVEDSYQFAYSHVLKADGIEQFLFENPEHHTGGIIYEIEGNVATPIQFFITDSISNFIRASFYYNTPVRQDSVAPVTEYIHRDIIKMIETLRWN